MALKKGDRAGYLEIRIFLNFNKVLRRLVAPFLTRSCSGIPWHSEEVRRSPRNGRKFLFLHFLIHERPIRGCTLAGNLEFFKDPEIGHCGGPGARETLPKGAGRRPTPFGMVSRAPGAAQTPKMADFRVLKKY